MKTKRGPKRRAGRPSIFDEGLTMDDLLKVYKQGLSCRKAAQVLGISPRAYRKYLHREGLSTTFSKPTPGVSIEFSNGYRIPQLLLWVRENPHKKLPRNMQKIALVTGIPFGTVRSYLRRRQRRLAAWVRSLGDLRELEGTVLLDDTSRHIPVELISTYTLGVDPYDLQVKISLVLKGGIVLKANLAWVAYAKLFGLTPKDAPWVPKPRTVKSPS